jgi:hypothetical protein
LDDPNVAPVCGVVAAVEVLRKSALIEGDAACGR